MSFQPIVLIHRDELDRLREIEKKFKSMNVSSESKLKLDGNGDSANDVADKNLLYQQAITADKESLAKDKTPLIPASSLNKQNDVGESTPTTNHTNQEDIVPWYYIGEA